MKLLSILTTLSLSVALTSAAEKKAADAKAPAKKAPPANFQPNPRKLNPPPGVVVPAEVQAELTAGVATLGKEIEALRKSLAGKPALLALLPDVQVYHNAVRYALEDDIFTSTNQFNSARALLKQGMDRAAALKSGNAPWNTRAGLLEVKRAMEAAAAEAAAKKKPPGPTPAPLTHVPVVRGYVSKIDGSVQPYGLKVPVTYLTGDDKPRRLDFWLHGRGDTLNEIAFIDGQSRAGGTFLPDDAFVLDPYGRFMNAFKFAGEVDVWEGLDHAAKHYPIDRNKLAMRGFSMGGAGAWHLGAHHPDKFASVNPGAGFVDVKNYQKLGDKLDAIPWWEQKLWNLYDPLACPINLVNSTLVAYSGEDDAQKAAADLMEAALLKDGVKMTHIIGPKTGHAYEKEAKVVVAKLVDEATNKRRDRPPESVALVTHTLKWNRAHWFSIEVLEKHWEPASASAKIFRRNLFVTTSNVTTFRLDYPTKVMADGQLLFPWELVVNGKAIPFPKGLEQKLRRDWPGVYVSQRGGEWVMHPDEPGPGLAKRHNLQGPIDDAFMDSFVMVRPTGQPLNAAVGQWAKTELAEAAFHWRRYFRGEPRVKDDSAITDDDIKNSNLVLWGDPSSNKLLARIAAKLPIQWNGKEIKVGGKSFDATKHAPAFIFPNPLNPSRYVVINSGFTFPQFAGASNSFQTPKLPDWAILDLSVPLPDRVGGKGVVAADFFGEKWEVK
ncbi:MAG: prolyl oligopeptidase family protein [Limisphaerales bacterium]|nr:MAG: prolyl oligopeptidase family protein [Limisphaerales bacterium]KAG0507822.1 MAG: prolyl oligopeptidase family protein [Limisphaerales bacterium]TXT48629.1 MAG: prolyl oligopeptidase family protein [Limisphaerales bacterium]